MAKTKAELEVEIQELRKQLNSASKKETYLGIASDVKSIFDSLIEVGFTPEQAWEMLKLNMVTGSRK